MQKQAIFKINGMQRDLSASAFNSEYAYENKNIRIMPTDESTLLSLINERGNKAVSITGIGDSIKGTPIGQSVINEELIVFTCGDDSIDKEITIESEESQINNINAKESTIDLDFPFYDRIYKLWFESGNLKGKELFKGDLNFNYKNPIEALSFYENSDIKKIYWVDGLNQPRVINIAAASNKINKWTNDSFNFVNKLKLNENVIIQRNIVASGSFAPGVLQYAFTYINSYGQESNIFYVSPLYYTSYNNRGASPEDKVSNSFDITIEGVDKSFDFLRIYSIHRTSIDSTPDVKRVVDLSLPTSGLSEYTTDTYSTYSKESLIYIRKRGTSERVSITELTPYETTNTKRYTIDGTLYDMISFGGEDSIDTASYIILNNNTYGATIEIKNENSIKIYNPFPFTLYDINRSKIVYTDNGLYGDSVDPTELLYKGGEEVIFGTITQKDNTLFLGDIKIKRGVLDSSIKDFFKGKDITFSIYNKSLTPPKPKGYYPYDNQLKLNSYQIKSFKYLEYYRFGIQIQHYTGKWSEPIWINDVQNKVCIDTTFFNDNTIGLPTAEYSLNDSSIINKLLDNGYIRIRPIIVYPTINDREVVCQGILCPTVYNVSDRFGNSPFAQSSWFIRPNAPFDEYTAFNYQGTTGADSYPLGTFLGYPPNTHSRAGIMANDPYDAPWDIDAEVYRIDNVNKGSWAEFRHNYPIPSNDKRNAEIQCIWNPPANPYIDTALSNSEISEWVSENSENFYIDQSILTLHSPDIEFDDEVRSIDTSKLKLRIVGIVPLTSFASDIDIQTSTPVNNFTLENGPSTDMPMGFYKEPIGVENTFTSGSVPRDVYGDAFFGWRGLISGAFWFDDLVYKSDRGNNNKLTTGFVVYPWHRNGSLNNTKHVKDGYKSALLDKKKLSNIKYSYKTEYMDSKYIWNAYVAGDSISTGISDVKIFDSNEISLIRLLAQENSNLPDINYYGNIDKVITYPLIGDKKEGYPIMTSGTQNADDNAHLLFIGAYSQVKSDYTDQTTGVDPVRMKYKSTPHAVLALNYTTAGNQRILPTIQDVNNPGYGTPWKVNYVGESEGRAFWDKKSRVVSQDIIDTHTSRDISTLGGIQYGWLWLGELYNDNVSNRFGGQTEEAFENNQWLPCGDPVSLIDNFGMIKANVTIKWEEGDTYYQRYDHIKTYPFTLEDQNAVTEIVSFMCETRVNIDGRYDKNRGQTNNFAITPENFNKLNDIYSQQNNFFNYRGLNTNKLNLDTFHNSITWTKTKTIGELTDTWTNITLASILDLDGDKGSVRALRRFNNNILSFQDKGISQILYNETMQISSNEGVPIEIANSGKVSGKRYISDRVGCTNKWSICETSNGIYFIDDITKGIYLFTGKIDNISDRLGFHSWVNKVSDSVDIWNPVDFNSFVTYYDKINGDVFFIGKNECLAFSEPLGQFTSFYSYEKMPYFINLEDKGLSFNIEDGGKVYKPWLHNEGDYNIFFGKYQPFYTTIIANPDMTADKIFNNVEFRSDSWNSKGELLNTTFDTLTTWNEYQEGVTSLTNVLGKPSDLKRKFRIWRANIPRDKSNGRDRMRNPWLYIKLSMNSENTDKTILHDMVVHYFE